MILNNKQKGMTFIEVLIAMVILVTGILGAVAMQASAKKGSFDAMQRSLASALAQDIIERMRSNDSDPNVLETYEGTYGAVANAVPVPRCNTPAALCTPAQMMANDIYEWELNLLGADVLNGAQNTGGLLGAVGCITHDDNAVTIVISWEGRENIADGAANNSATARACGTSTNKRRQISVDAFIF